MIDEAGAGTNPEIPASASSGNSSNSWQHSTETTALTRPARLRQRKPPPRNQLQRHQGHRPTDSPSSSPITASFRGARSAMVLRTAATAATVTSTTPDREQIIGGKHQGVLHRHEPCRRPRSTDCQNHRHRRRSRGDRGKSPPRRHGRRAMPLRASVQQFASRSKDSMR